MTGNAKALKRPSSGWFPSLTQGFSSYVAIDGGSGTHLLAALANYDPSLQEAASPRHANVLLICEPITQKLLPAVAEVAATLARPFQVLILGEASDAQDRETIQAENAGVRLEELFPHAHRLAQPTPEAILSAVRQYVQAPEGKTFAQPQIDATTIQLPQKKEMELATEVAVLSLGPIQPLTAGPLRLLLICDGDQVFSAQVDAGYAWRDIEQSMMQADWSHSLALARLLDPLAPLAGQLAYVRAVEQLQHWQAPSAIEQVREAALALERVHNILWWSVRFAHLLDDAPLMQRLYRLAQTFTEHASSLWQHAPTAWVLPQYQVPFSSLSGTTATVSRLRQIGDGLEGLIKSIERNRFLALRTHTIGVLTAERLTEAGVSGPVLEASRHGTGDVQSRLVTRLRSALLDVHAVAETLSHSGSVPPQAAQWNVPAGEAQGTVAGPRGIIGLHLVSEGGEQPTHVLWRRPSAALLPLLPEMLKGQTLADAQIIVASLDLAMAEADG